MLRSSAQDDPTDAFDARLRLLRLQAERLDVVEAGVDQGCAYMERLQAAIGAARVEYVTAAVAEIAVLRADLGAPQTG